MKEDKALLKIVSPVQKQRSTSHLRYDHFKPKILINLALQPQKLYLKNRQKKSSSLSPEIHEKKAERTISSSNKIFLNTQIPEENRSLKSHESSYSERINVIKNQCDEMLDRRRKRACRSVNRETRETQVVYESD